MTPYAIKDQELAEIMRLQQEYAKIHRRMTNKPLPRMREQDRLQRREDEIRQRVEALGGTL